MKITSALAVAIGLAGVAACGGGGEAGEENAAANTLGNMESATEMNMGGTGFENDMTSGAGTGSTGYGGTAGTGLTGTEGENAAGNTEAGNEAGGNEGQ